MIYMSDSFPSHTIEWHCPPPPNGVAYTITSALWVSDTVCEIHEWRAVPAVRAIPGAVYAGNNELEQELWVFDSNGRYEIEVED